jgi:hypothetical protein
MGFWRLKRLTDWQAVLTLVSLTLLLKVIVLIQQPILARDGIYYIRFAQELTKQDWPAVLRQGSYHPGYPLAIAGVAQVYQVFHSGNLTPDEWQWCAHLAASHAGVLLVIPLYGLVRCFFSTKLAWTSVALFSILPATVQITTDTLAESWLLLFLFSSLWCLIQAVRKQQGFWFGLSGLVAGVGYFFRLEMLLVPAAGLMVLVTRRWWDGGKMSWPCALRGSAALLSCFLLTIAPYVLTIGKLSPRPSWGQVLQACELKNGTTSFAGPNYLLASRMQDGVNGLRIEALRLCDALRLMGMSLAKAGHYFLWPLAAVGLFVLWPHSRRDVGVGVLWCVVIVDALILLRLGYTAGYLSERHALVLVAIACIPASIGLFWLRDRLCYFGSRCWMSAGLALCCSLLCVPKALQPLHGSQEGHRQAGYYLERALTEKDELIDPYHWASFYAGREMVACSRSREHVAPTMRPTGGRTLVVIDPHDADLNRQAEWKKAGTLEDRSIFWWPSNEHPKVLIRQSRQSN